MLVFLCFWHVKRAQEYHQQMQTWHSCGGLQAAWTNHADVAWSQGVSERLQTTSSDCLESLFREHADQPGFVEYFTNTWGHKLGTV